MSDPTIPCGRKKRAIVKELHSRGVFNLKDSVVRTAELLQVSRNTIYMYIREIDEKNAESEERN